MGKAGSQTTADRWGSDRAKCIQNVFKTTCTHSLSNIYEKKSMQLYVRDRHLLQRNGLILSLKLALFGQSRLCEYEGLEYYTFRCPTHGLVIDHARGHDRYLDCCYCRDG